MSERFETFCREMSPDEADAAWWLAQCGRLDELRAMFAQVADRARETHRLTRNMGKAMRQLRRLAGWRSKGERRHIRRLKAARGRNGAGMTDHRIKGGE